MSPCKHPLPAFRNSCLAVCALYVMLGGAVVLRGTRAAMAPYGVPEATLASAHYDDAIRWVYVHMVVLGLLIGLLGITLDTERARRLAARTLLAVHVVYTAMDFRASESFLGTGLYRGPASVGPAVISLGVTLLFAHLSFCAPSRSGAPTEG